jgi:aquaglyceroporin related protein
MSTDKATESVDLPSPSISPTVFHDENTHPNTSNHNLEPNPSDAETAYAEHGAGIDHKIAQDDEIQSMPNLWWSRQRHRFREPLAEFFGVFIMILFGDG